MHDYGIFTVEGQPSKQQGPSAFAGNEAGSLIWVETQQRAFLRFMLPQPNGGNAPDCTRDFCESLVAHPDIFAIFSYQEKDDIELQDQRIVGPYIHKHTGSLTENDFTMTRRRTSSDRKTLNQQPWSTLTTLDHTFAFEGKSRLKWPMEDYNPVVVSVWSKAWEGGLRGTLELLVEQLAVEAGM